MRIGPKSSPDMVPVEVTHPHLGLSKKAYLPQLLCRSEDFWTCDGSPEGVTPVKSQLTRRLPLGGSHMKMIASLRAILPALFVAFAIPAQANTLIGDIISGSYHYPGVCCDVNLLPPIQTGGTTYAYSTNPFVVAVGSSPLDDPVETVLTLNPSSGGAIPNPTVNFSADSLVLTFISPASYTCCSEFNGPVFYGAFRQFLWLDNGRGVIPSSVRIFVRQLFVHRLGRRRR